MEWIKEESAISDIIDQTSLENVMTMAVIIRVIFETALSDPGYRF